MLVKIKIQFKYKNKMHHSSTILLGYSQRQFVNIY